MMRSYLTMKTRCLSMMMRRCRKTCRRSEEPRRLNLTLHLHDTERGRLKLHCVQLRRCNATDMLMNGNIKELVICWSAMLSCFASPTTSGYEFLHPGSTLRVPWTEWPL